MPIIFGTSSRDPDVWRCDYYNFSSEQACKKEEMVSPERVPKGWVELEGEVFCPEHMKDEEKV